MPNCKQILPAEFADLESENFAASFWRVILARHSGVSFWRAILTRKKFLARAPRARRQAPGARRLDFNYTLIWRYLI
jgi:hypothetical protein